MRTGDDRAGDRPEPHDAAGPELPTRRAIAAVLAVLGSLLVVPSLVLPVTAVSWSRAGAPSQPLFEQWVTGRVRWAATAAGPGILPPHGSDAGDSPVALVLLVAAVLAGLLAGVLWWSARTRGRLAGAAAAVVLALSLYLGAVSAGAREVAFGAVGADAAGTPVASVTPAGGLGIVSLALWSAALTLMLWQLRRPRAARTAAGNGAGGVASSGRD